MFAKVDDFVVVVDVWTVEVTELSKKFIIVSLDLYELWNFNESSKFKTLS